MGGVNNEHGGNPNVPTLRPTKKSNTPLFSLNTNKKNFCRTSRALSVLIPIILGISLAIIGTLVLSHTIPLPQWAGITMLTLGTTTSLLPLLMTALALRRHHQLHVLR